MIRRIIQIDEENVTAAAPVLPPVTRVPSAWWMERQNCCGMITAMVWGTVCRPVPWTPSLL